MRHEETKRRTAPLKRRKPVEPARAGPGKPLRKRRLRAVSAAARRSAVSRQVYPFARDHSEIESACRGLLSQGRQLFVSFVSHFVGLVIRPALADRQSGPQSFISLALEVQNLTPAAPAAEPE